MTRILVCGGRNFTDREFLFSCLDQSPIKPEVVIHGAAKGADILAGEWAKECDIPVLAFPADWDKHGKRAGYIRNKQMLDEGKPDFVIAFPGGAGTKMMVRLALDAGVPVWETYA